MNTRQRKMIEEAHGREPEPGSRLALRVGDLEHAAGRWAELREEIAEKERELEELEAADHEDATAAAVAKLTAQELRQQLADLRPQSHEWATEAQYAQRNLDEALRNLASLEREVEKLPATLEAATARLEKARARHAAITERIMSRPPSPEGGDGARSGHLLPNMDTSEVEKQIADLRQRQAAVEKALEQAREFWLKAEPDPAVVGRAGQGVAAHG